jgi:DNA invertase Pin-like site-specific DNA recombinase
MSVAPSAPATFDKILSDLRGKRAYLYGRVSREEQQKHGYSLEEQQDKTRREAARLGLTVVGESFEQGSGRDWELAGIVDLAKRAKRGEFDVAIIKDTSRLSRNQTKTAYLYYELEQAGAVVHFTDERFEPTRKARCSGSSWRQSPSSSLRRPASAQKTALDAR